MRMITLAALFLAGCERTYHAESIAYDQFNPSELQYAKSGGGMVDPENCLGAPDGKTTKLYIRKTDIRLRRSLALDFGQDLGSLVIHTGAGGNEYTRLWLTTPDEVPIGIIKLRENQDPKKYEVEAPYGYKGKTLVIVLMGPGSASIDAVENIK